MSESKTDQTPAGEKPSESLAPKYYTYPLGLIFFLWKSVLLFLALFSAIAPSYDTSSAIFLNATAESYDVEVDGPLPPAHAVVTILFDKLPFISTLVERLTRWDAVYFIKSAQRGYHFEQEWAFGKGQPMAVETILRGCESMAIGFGVHTERVIAGFGVVVGITAHFYAMWALHDLVKEVSGNKRLAYLAAVLHIISPAGLFLTAPYAEAPFAFLSFTALLKYASILKLPKGSWERFRLTVWSGVLFGMATVCRSNGLMYGLIFAWELAEGLVSLPQSAEKGKLIRSLVATTLAGIFVGAGSIIPQLVGYITFCGNGVDERREWCNSLLPSIYSHVQSRYWNVGFLRYWVPGNIPLFALALPMLYILYRSGRDVFEVTKISTTKDTEKALRCSVIHTGNASPYRNLIKSLAIGQIVLAVLAFTSYHVQIITRISSGYPLWYIWVAEQLASSNADRIAVGKKTVIYMVMYALIQGILYACFLPPA